MNDLIFTWGTFSLHLPAWAGLCVASLLAPAISTRVHLLALDRHGAQMRQPKEARDLIETADAGLQRLPPQTTGRRGIRPLD